MRRDIVGCGAAGLLALGLAGCGGASANLNYTDFVIAVGTETFVLRTSHPETIRLAHLALEGKSAAFPLGPLRPGDGGWNAPWSWHLDPEETRMVEAAIEVCDGTPSYVEAHLEDFPTYCPWGGRVVAARP
jgi:hypothetical protein